MSRKVRFSLPVFSASKAFSQLPPAVLAMRCACSGSMPRCCTSACSMSLSAMRFTSMRCVLLLMVSSSLSGSSHSMMNTVRCGGSSSSLSSLLALVRFMRSGSQMMLTLNPPWLDFMFSCRASSSLSAPVMMACWFSPPMAFIHSSNEKYGLFISVCRHSAAKSALTGWCSALMLFSLMVG